jgi:cytochrome c peroxidase
MIKKILFLLLSSQLLTTATSIDDQLEKLIEDNNLQALGPSFKERIEVVRLGSSLFRDRQLSGNKDITCMHCHHPGMGTSDLLPLPIGAGGEGLGQSRQQREAKIIPRNSPALINLGYKEIKDMFWDGRVSYDKKTKILQTPEPAFNGKNPKAAHITKLLNSSLAAQVIFPITSKEEMRGFSQNELAEAQTNLEVWDRVMKRLLYGEFKDFYREQFAKAFPKTKVEELNIGHVGNAMAAFISYNFNLINTPYDRYLNGDKDAMTHSEKKGLKVFLTRGKCINCHAGKHLSNFQYKSTGTPQIGTVNSPKLDDRGRFDVTGEKRDQYKFRTPPLRNIVLTAPYMHSGVFTDLEQVIEHYDNVKKSMANFKVTEEIQRFYDEKIVHDKDPKREKLRFNLMSIGELRKGLKLTDNEKSDLLNFIKDALTDDRIKSNETTELFKNRL